MAQQQSSNEPVFAANEAVAGILDEITDLTVKQGDDTRDAVKHSIEILIRDVITSERRGTRIDKKAVDQMIAEYDARLSKQVDAVMHAPEFQKAESAWRGLKLLVDRTDFRENIKLEIVSVTKDELREDFEDSPEIVKSGLYKTVYSKEYGVLGGKPYGAIIGNYSFDPGSQDMALLQDLSKVASMAHAPFLGAAGPQFFGLENFEGLPNMNDLADNLRTARHTKWQSFRETEDSRYVGLTVPRFLLRAPYSEEDNPVKGFTYNEDVSGTHENYLWGNTAFALASRLTEAFAKYRWCYNITGPAAGGAVRDLPVHTFESKGQEAMKVPTEVVTTDRRELELADEGFIPLVWRKDTDSAVFMGAQSAQAAKKFGSSPEGLTAERNFKLGTRLPYLFVVSRLAHYLKNIQRENIGRGLARAQMETELQNWIGQFVSAQDIVDDATAGKRPLRNAAIEVSDIDGDPGWYRIDMKVQPRIRFEGAFVDLSLVGKLDKE
ncbi:MAG: type VI secretion system contractile sheath large subunit [Planctomycetota bacterium]